MHDGKGDHHQPRTLEAEAERLPVGEFVEVHREPAPHPGGAGKQHLHRRLHALADPGWAGDVRGSGAVGELAVQDQEREAAEVVAVQVRHQHQPNLVGILALLLEGDQRGGAAVQQDITAVVARGVQQDAGLEAAAAAEGVTGANEPHLDGVGGHALTLPCMDRPDCDTRQAGTRSADLGKAPTTSTGVY
jgi:hypothetical protein